MNSFSKQAQAMAQHRANQEASKVAIDVKFLPQTYREIMNKATGEVYAGASIRGIAIPTEDSVNTGLGENERIRLILWDNSSRVIFPEGFVQNPKFADMTVFHQGYRCGEVTAKEVAPWNEVVTAKNEATGAYEPVTDENGAVKTRKVRQFQVITVALQPDDFYKSAE